MTAYFTKGNTSGFGDALIVEARGLALLLSTIADAGIQELSVPEVHRVDRQTLMIERIHSSVASSDQVARLGRGLAKLHQIKQADYGLEYDNYIGLNPQKNGQFNDWGRFFVEQRLAYQVSLIKSSPLRQTFQACLDSVRDSLILYLNEHCDHPSLVHGDLWSGNVLFDDQYCWLIDPAVYYGDREVDLAMTELFGGYSSDFYQAYDAEYPRTKAYSSKKIIYNLYHYLNHYNLFGDSYLSACEQGFQWLEQTFIR
ncbi:fructosamine kinase family protein [Litoribrevibacter albus]|uniref:Fructosamine kinase n=1 Tax=Litoribrevibacter albus TaxID=1473156 RepID=A0AA37SA31_9GAMM|nr:fructosamine kinase family protein [Litoribrevibacter albus]GLQ30842.1 hypothetical protein GCM10007876_13210 [Litoribrevibacter albus]